MSIKFYKIIITPIAYREINKIYEYITEELYAGKAAQKLMKRVEKQIQSLKYYPRMYPKIRKIDNLKRRYRRIVINNYVILYTIDEKKKIVFISNMYYGGKNYIDSEF